jgi:hypothetical protein
VTDRKSLARRALIVVAVILGGCGSSRSLPNVGGAAPRVTAGLSSALASVADGPEGQAYFAWSDNGAIERLSGASADSRHPGGHGPWLSSLGIGDLEILADPDFQQQVGFDPDAPGTAVSIGLPGRRAVRLEASGTSTAAVGADLRKLGAATSALDGHPLYHLTVTQTYATADSFGLSPLMLEQFVPAATGTLIAGQLPADLTPLLGGGARPLASDPQVAAAAKCLGDVEWTEIFSPLNRWEEPIAKIGIGAVTPASASSPVTAVLCVVTPAAAGGLELARLRRTVVPGFPLLALHRTLGDLAARETLSATTIGGYDVDQVTLSLRAGQPAALLYLWFDSAGGELDDLVSLTCPPGSDETAAELRASCHALGYPRA